MENEIKEFFHAAAPQPGDDLAFSLELNARLAALEKVRLFRKREISRSRRIALVFFVVGLLIGGIIAALFILHPEIIERLWESLLGLIGWKAALSKDDLLWLLAFPTALLSVVLTWVFSRLRVWRF